MKKWNSSHSLYLSISVIDCYWFGYNEIQLKIEMNPKETLERLYLNYLVHSPTEVRLPLEFSSDLEVGQSDS